MKYSKTHTAYFNPEGIEVPSVTTILKIVNKPFLVKWANIMGFRREKVEDILNDSAYIGTLVHQIIEAYLMKKMYIPIYGRMNSKMIIMMHLSSFISWMKTKDEVLPIFMERQVTSERFGGTIDFYGTVDGKYTILDFKTSKKAYATMFLQLAAYCIMLEEQGLQVDQVAIINVRRDKYIETIVSREDLQYYIDAFQTLLTFFHTWYDLNLKMGWGDILAD